MINNDSDTTKPPVLEEQTAESQLTPLPTKPRHRALKGTMAALLALVVLLAVIQGYFIFTVKQWQQQQSRQLTMVEDEETAASQQLEKFQQQQQESKKQQNLTHQQQQQSMAALTTLAAQVKQLSLPLSGQQAWQALSEIQFQLYLAQQYLTVGIVNLPVALTLVEAAEQQVKNSQQTSVVQLQASISRLQQQLSQLPQVNLNQLSLQFTKLQALAEQLATAKSLPEKVTTDNKPAVVVVNSQPATWYQRQWDSLRTYLSQVVIVRHHQQLLTPLSLSQRQLESSQIRLALLQAHWAILQQNQTLYQHSLQHCQQLITQYFTGQPQSANMLAVLHSLMQVELQPSMPSFAPVFADVEEAFKQLEMTVPSSLTKVIVKPRPQSQSHSPANVAPSTTSPQVPNAPSPVKKKQLEHPANPEVEI